jgi:hypothetical protein
MIAAAFMALVVSGALDEMRVDWLVARSGGTPQLGDALTCQRTGPAPKPR